MARPLAAATPGPRSMYSPRPLMGSDRRFHRRARTQRRNAMFACEMNLSETSFVFRATRPSSASAASGTDLHRVSEPPFAGASDARDGIRASQRTPCSESAVTITPCTRGFSATLTEFAAYRGLAGGGESIRTLGSNWLTVYDGLLTASAPLESRGQKRAKPCRRRPFGLQGN